MFKFLKSLFSSEVKSVIPAHRLREAGLSAEDRRLNRIWNGR